VVAPRSCCTATEFDCCVVLVTCIGLLVPSPCYGPMQHHDPQTLKPVSHYLVVASAVTFVLVTRFASASALAPIISPWNFSNTWNLI